MNRPQRKLVIWFSVVTAMLIAATTAVLAYAAYQAGLSRHGDIFDRLVSDNAFTWIEPRLISIAGAFLVTFVLFVGLWRSHGDDRPRHNG